MVAVVMEPVQLGAEMAVLKHVIDHVAGIAVVVLWIVKDVVVSAHLAVVAHVDLAVLVHVMAVATDLALEHVQMTVKVLVQGIVKVDVLQAVLHVMVVSLVMVAMVVAALGAIHHVIQVLMPNLVSSLRGD